MEKGQLKTIDCSRTHNDLRFLTSTKVSATGRIALVPIADSSGCYFYEFLKNGFAFVDLETETETEFAFEGYKLIKGVISLGNFIVVQSDADDTRFLTLAIERESGKLYTALFSANFTQRKVAINAEQWTGFDRKKECYLRLHKSSSGEIYSVTYWWKELTTIISLMKIKLTENSEIASYSIFDEKIVKGCWLKPFIENDAIYFLPSRSTLDKLLKISLDGLNVSHFPIFCSCVNCGNKKSHSFIDGYNSRPIYFNDRIYFARIEEKRIEVWSFNIDDSKEEKKFMRCEGIIHWEELEKPLPSLSFHYTLNGTALLAAGSKIFHINFQISDNYTVSKNVLGAGTYGMVVKGTLSDLEVAIKVIKPIGRTFTDLDLQRKIARLAVTEAKKLNSINHKYVVKAFGWKIEEERFLLFMELMKESVRDKILRSDGKRLGEEQAFAILQQALEGLVHLHTLKPKPIVHRDIKCLNLLIDDTGIVKLGDFGQVKTVLLTSTGATDPDFHLTGNGNAGTSFWQAPEVLSSSVAYGRKADVWSMGCCLVEMLTGYPPYFLMKSTEWAIKANDGTLKYDPKEFIPQNSCSASISLLEKMFRRQTKLDTNQRRGWFDRPQSVRPHSWEILADVMEFNEVLPLQEELKSVQLSFQRKINDAQQRANAMRNVNKNCYQ